HQEHIAVHYEKVNDTDLARYVVDIALHPQDTDSCCERDEITGRVGTIACTSSARMLVGIGISSWCLSDGYTVELKRHCVAEGQV
ncbi:hypothetical protein SARC_17265, partial [Sphaeroforma arctica JP610]